MGGGPETKPTGQGGFWFNVSRFPGGIPRLTGVLGTSFRGRNHFVNNYSGFEEGMGMKI